MLKIKFNNFLILTAILLLLQACGSNKTMVLQKPVVHNQIKSIKIISDNANVDLPENYQKIFEDTLETKLYKKQLLAKGSDLSVHYRFIQFDKGNQFSRWFLGGLGNAGEGSLTVEAIFLDRQGREIGKVHTEGKIGSGFFGGSISYAVEQAADALANYIVKNFLKDF